MDRWEGCRRRVVRNPPRGHIWRAAVAIRPEEATIGNAGDTNAIAGEVTNVEYGGRDSLVDVRTQAGTVIHVRAPKPPRVGESTHVVVPVARALVYPVG